jgi:hypothetical protein
MRQAEMTPGASSRTFHGFSNNLHNFRGGCWQLAYPIGGGDELEWLTSPRETRPPLLNRYQSSMKERNPMGNEPDENAIRKRAHQIWIEEGKPDGKAVDHWLRALWELRLELVPKAELDRLEHEFEPAHS